jgi:non-specific serine/threonine protein kinase
MDAGAELEDLQTGGAFGAALRRRRLAAGLTQEALAERAGLGVRTLQGLEEGEHRPRRATLRRLAAALGLGSDPASPFAAVAPVPRRPWRPGTALRLLPPERPARRPAPEAPEVGLPVQLTSFVGRGRELDDVLTLLDTGRMVTLTGPGGCGKTRLAFEAARALLDGPGGGARARESPVRAERAVVVDLAPLRDPALVPAAVGAAAGTLEAGQRHQLESLAAALGRRRTLLVLDNCEHLVGACAILVEALLRARPALRILATSREPLGAPGEAVYAVPPLSFPARGSPSGGETAAGRTEWPDPPEPREGLTPAAVLRYDAVRLFVERARAALAGFALTPENAPAVGAICRRLDGLPLAIELAAARVRVLTPGELLAHLDDRFRILTAGGRTAPPRHRTLRAALDWSYDLLGAPERALLGRLGVFVGGFSLGGAEAVAGPIAPPPAGRGRPPAPARPDETPVAGPAPDGDPGPSVLDLLGGLVDRSLVVAEPRGDEGRYRLLETIRAYALERLHASGEAPDVTCRHAAYYLALAEHANRELGGGQQRLWLDRLERDHENLRAALRWLVERAEVGLGLRLGAALWLFWSIRGHLSEGRARLGELLALPGAAPDTAARAEALRGAGALAGAQGDYAAARAYLEESLACRRRLGDRGGTASVLASLGILEVRAGTAAGARSLYEESLALFRELGDREGTARMLVRLADIADTEGDHAAARSRYEEGLALFRELGDVQSIAATRCSLGAIARRRGDYGAAGALLEESVARLREVGARSDLAWALRHLGELRRGQADAAGARACYQESLAICREVASRVGIGRSLVGLAAAALDRGDAATADALAQQGVALFRELGSNDGLAGALLCLGTVQHRRGDHGRAAGLAAEAMDRFREGGRTGWLAEALELLASAAGAGGEAEHGAVLWGAAAALRSAGDTVPPPAERRLIERGQAAARRALGAARFAAAWASGRAMTPEQATAAAHAVAEEVGRTARPPVAGVGPAGERTHEGAAGSPAAAAGLTAREAEVLRLVAAGRSNRAIAAALALSLRTVERHVANLYAKIDAHNRAEATAFAIRHGLA